MTIHFKTYAKLFKGNSKIQNASDFISSNYHIDDNETSDNHNND